MNLSNPSDNKRLHSEYFSLYESRKNLSHSKQLLENPQTYSFKPSLNPNTEEIAKSIKSKRLETYKESKPEKVLEMIEKESKER
jgi:hypothetical protein